MTFTRAVLTLSFVAGTSLAWSAPAGEASWPEFRGPTRQGTSDAVGLPVKWSTTENIAWKADLPGRAWSSPVVGDGVVYLTNAVGAKDSTDPHDTFSLRVMALNATDGKTIWDREVFVIKDPHTFGIHGKNSYASPTPVLEGDRIYAHFGHFGTACLNTKGDVQWKNQQVTYSPVHGGGACPVLVDDLLIFPADAASNPFVVALDKRTGKMKWKTDRTAGAKKTFSFSTPLVIEVKGEKQLVSPGSNVVSALNPKDGSEIWKVSYEGYSVVPRPIYAQGLVFLSTGYDRPTGLAIRPDGKGDVTGTHVVWRMEKGAPLTPSMLAVGEDLFSVADNGIVSCFEAKTGKLFWQERVARATSASPLYADGKIYIQDELGNGYVIKASRQLELLSTNALGQKSLASYAVNGRQLLIRTQNTLFCVGTP
ncbi:PQQ-binding-like beta-propeller repeat protein [Verrucomicrobium spinosum]|uniref:outer membrane protein assembly factor BamB family protein n=1 Tax=Verrucomicrobium spinosum TaxID=2736 RepID=UPI000174694B|nr:PQQ-binding-like beta-propeller repeat protein [Verrucomicrobium spinosum]